MLKLTPVLKDYLWGGYKLKGFFGRDNGGRKISESWEVSVHPDGLSGCGEGTLADYIAQNPKSVDEAGSAWELDMVDKDLLQEAVLRRPAAQECVLTAHGAPRWMLDAADYSTEMKCHRHPYQKGIAARQGIEY